ncbi:MAG: tetratricopeptide repeat protein [Methylophilus sp.]
MKLEKTLSLSFITMILLSLNSYGADANSQITVCNQALDNANPRQAVQIADALLKQNNTQADALLCKGRALNALGQNDEAEKSLVSAVMNAQPGFNSTIANLILGNFYKQHQRTDLALVSYQKSLASSKLENNQKFMRISHNLIAEAYTQKQDYNAALSSYQAGSELANNDNERADSYERLSSIYQSLNQLDNAVEFQLKAVLMQKKSGTLDQYAEASLTLGQLFTQNKDYSSAEKTLQRLLKFSQENGGDYYEAKTDLYLAQTKQAQGDKTSATSLLQDAKKIAEKIQANDLVASIKKAEETNQ